MRDPQEDSLTYEQRILCPLIDASMFLFLCYPAHTPTLAVIKIWPYTMTQERWGTTLEPQARKSRSYLHTHLYTIPTTPPRPRVHRKLKPVKSPVMEYHEVLRFHRHVAAQHSSRNVGKLLYFKWPQNNNIWNACNMFIWRQQVLMQTSLNKKSFSDLHLIFIQRRDYIVANCNVELCFLCSEWFGVTTR